MDWVKIVVPAIAGFLVLGVAGFWVGFMVSRRAARQLVSGAEQERERTVKQAQEEAIRAREKSEAAAKIEWEREKLKFETQTATTRRELERLEAKLSERESFLARRDSVLTQKEADLIRKDRDIGARDKIVRAKMERLDQLISQENSKLERIAGLSSEEARRELCRNLENQARLEAAQIVRDIKEEARGQAEEEAREIIIRAIQRCAVSHAAETTVSVVSLPSDELKGRIIGREGRNIRALEAVTGVDFIVDDTPETVVLSAHNPVRREIARISLERLITDGRIHPGRIEEIVAKVTAEVETDIAQTGEQATFDIGVHGIHPELVKLIGRLKYRTSYAQNILQHSKEVAFLSGIMAAELGQEVKLAKRAGLLHDIGKAVDHEVEGSHASIGMDLARKYGESEEIIRAIGAHHEEIKPESIIDVIVQAADALSGARPGARREMLETYVKRLEDLERIAGGFPGVEMCYAIQAGREIRIIVQADKIDDDQTAMLSRDIARKVEAELSYPGQIKIVCIREHRAVEFAK